MHDHRHVNQLTACTGDGVLYIVKTSEGSTVRLRRLATLKQRAGATRQKRN